jgi:predicted nucleic acid-binding protein
MPMDFLIEDLGTCSVEPINYLLDSNIWLKVISPQNKEKPSDRKYRAFFEEIIATKGAKIVLPALVVSEVMNRLLRDIHYKKFKINKGVPPDVDSSFYKNHFRPSAEYRAAYALIADEFRIYLNNLILINDDFGKSIKYKHVLSHFNFNLDFNDCYYYHLSKKNKYVMVTDDGDFYVSGIRILTLNTKLLSK